MSISELRERETELLDLLESEEYLKSNYFFATYSTPDILFHGCMKNYVPQNFGVLVHKHSNQTYAGYFSPKLVLENEGVYFFHPKETKKGADDVTTKERPDPPFNYKGYFKDSLFDGPGVMDFGTESERLRFEGTFKEGKRHGFGILRKDEEIIVQGEWVEDQYIEPEKDVGFQKDGLDPSKSFEEFDRAFRESLDKNNDASSKPNDQHTDKFSSFSIDLIPN